MGAGFGFLHEMRKTLKQNKELLEKAKESFERRKGIKLAKNREFTFNELPAEELEELKASLRAKAQARKRKERTVIGVLAVLFIVIIFVVVQMGDFSTPLPSFRSLKEEDKDIVQSLSSKIAVAFKVGDYGTVRSAWHGKFPTDVAVTTSGIHLFIRERNAEVDLSEVTYFKDHAEAEISIFSTDSLITTRYQFKMLDDELVITDFTLGDWPELHSKPSEKNAGG